MGEQPVEADYFQPRIGGLLLNFRPALAAHLAHVERRFARQQRKGGDFDAGVSQGAHRRAGLIEGRVFEHLIAEGVFHAEELVVSGKW